jgi:thiol-disulfide isomerase/thioredoxin
MLRIIYNISGRVIYSALFILMILLFLSCSEQEKKFSISGKLENAAGKMIYLYEMSAVDFTVYDSVVTGIDGTFRFDGEIDRIRFMPLRENHFNQVFLIVKPGDDIQVTADYNNLPQTAGIEGSAESELAVEMNRKMYSTIMRLDSLGRYYRSNLTGSAREIETLRQKIAVEFEEIAEEQRQFTIDFIKRNPTSLASLMALYQQIDPNTFILNQQEDFQYYSLVDSLLIAKYPDLDYTITLNENVREMKRQFEMRRQKEDLLGIGAVAPEISLPDPDGETVSLSSLRGKFVLLDFWAAWCGPCREENPYLVEAYNKYNGRGFDIYQVSLDRTREAWLRGIEEDKLNRWTHVSDLQFWGSQVVPLYRIEGIPANYLLDQEGRIIAVNLRGEALERTLSEIFN